MAEGRSDIVRRDVLALAHALGVLRMARRTRDIGVLDSSATLRAAYDVIAENGRGPEPAADGERRAILDILDAALGRELPAGGGHDPVEWAEHSLQQRLDQLAI